MTLPPIKSSIKKGPKNIGNTTSNRIPTLPNISTKPLSRIQNHSNITILPTLITKPDIQKTAKILPKIERIILLNVNPNIFSKPAESNPWKEIFSNQVMPQVVNVGPLTRYKQDRLEVLKSLEQHMDFSEFRSENHAKNTVNVDICNTLTGDSSFTVAMEADHWKIINSFKNKDDKSFYMSDVIAIVYSKYSRKYNFFGSLPSAIMRCNICNSEALELIKLTETNIARNQMTRKEQFSLFMNNTVNGKSTKNFLDVFGLEAYEMHWDGSNVSLLARKKNLF